MPAKANLVVALATGVLSVLCTARQPDPLAAVEARMERLQANVERAESVRAIKRLQYAYGHYVELGLWNDFADLFAEDAVTNYQAGGRGEPGVRGRAAIRELFFQQVGQGKLGLAEGRIYPHILFQPVITLAPDGRTAKGRWRILAMLGGYKGTATWYSGVYENEYVLENSVWKISVIHSEPRVTAAYTAAGWKDSGVHVPFHYTARSITTPSPRSAGPNAGLVNAKNDTTPSLTSLANHVNQLAQRAARLNDQAEIANLQDSYGYAIDRKLWDQAADLFTGDGTLELGQRGVYVGKAGIRRALDQFGPQGLRDGERNDHVYLQTIVTVAPDGRTANARGVELIMSSAPGGRNGDLTEGTFENTFVRQDVAWKIRSVHFYPRMIVDAALGWARSARPAPGPSKEFPPDRPPTSTYEIYPRFSVAPFHYNNPVSGKPPQYPDGVSTTAAATSTTASAAAPVSKPAIHNAAGLNAALANAARSLARAEAWDAAENLMGAWGYYLDESPDDAAGLFVKPGRQVFRDREGSIFVNQILQPVIDVAPDGSSAKIRARLLDLAGTPGGAGYWTAGAFEGQLVSNHGAWKFETARSVTVWSAPYPGGWAQTP